MKTILCFGDSLTWGWNPENSSRYPIDQRWTGLLQQQLGPGFRIVEEGLNGRTTIFDDPFSPGRNSIDILPIVLESHAPLDLVIVLLGINDLKSYIKGEAKSAALGNLRLIRLILSSRVGPMASAPTVLLLSPPLITQSKGIMAMAFENVEVESKKMSGYYREVASFANVHFLDTSEFLTTSSLDGVHLDHNNNCILAENLTLKIREIFSQ